MKIVSAVFAITIAYSTHAAGFSTAAPMATARSLHTATLLQSGKVLVAGGESDGGGTILSAELYDPVANSWSSAGSLAAGRKRHTATLLPDGTVLVTGGLGDSGTLSSAELYDPVANGWSTSSSMSTPRQDHTATLLPNGKVLIAGGDSQVTVTGSLTITALNSSEIYDPSSSGWTPAPNLAKAHFYHTASLLTNGKVLVVSGFATTLPAMTTTANAELYDYIANAWTPGGTLATGRAQSIAAPLSFGRVLVAGGINGTNRLASAELYDSELNSWSATGALIAARNLHTATRLNTGQVLVAAGFNGTDALASAELYDPAGASWSSAGNLAAARQSHTATLLQNGMALVAGGINQIELASAELYDSGAASGPLTLNSSPTAAPNPAFIGQSVTFSASASGGMGALSYTWSFGDGGSGAGASVSHAYAVAGTYTATVNVTDTASSSVSGSVNVTVAGVAPAVVVGIGTDSDGDGFSNVVEQTMGSDPADSNSVPLGVTNVSAPLPLKLLHLHTRLIFTRGNRDSIGVTGFLPIPAGFATAGTKVGIDVNGVPYLAILNSQGRSGSVFKLYVKSAGGVVPAQTALFSIALKGGTYSPALAASGLTNGDFIRQRVSLVVSILFNTKLYQVLQPQFYSARLDHYGMSR